MRTFITGIVAAILLTSSAGAGQSDQFKYRIGAIYGLGNIKAPEKPYFSFNHAWGISIGTAGTRASIAFSFLVQENHNDSGASGHFEFFSDRDHADMTFSSLRAGFDAEYLLKRHGRLRPFIGGGLGYLVWKYADPIGDTVIQTAGDRGNRVDFSAAELYLSGALGLDIALSGRTAINFKTSVDYLTGLGTSFSDSANDTRGRFLARAGLTLVFRFGGSQILKPESAVWPSADSWSRQGERVRPAPAAGDSDADGIDDKQDKCPGTPLGAVVDRFGCPSDSDRDGVMDGFDDCPETPFTARGFIDIFGCPIDSDFDGVPDYRDSCRSSRTGVVVNENGCPLDSDGDGVPDGIDDCPGTVPGIEVDKRGCIDITFLNDTMRINIDYQPGSFEVDMRTKERLQPLITKLKFLQYVRIQIIGYTDNVGTAEANQALSQKRANRMRDWLETQGIAGERMTPVGRGETNFITSNQTAEGRAMNRRIELIFSR